MSTILEDLEQADLALSRAVGKLNRTRGGRMPNGTLWIGELAEQRRAVSLLLKLQALKAKIARYGV